VEHYTRYGKNVGRHMSGIHNDQYGQMFSLYILLLCIATWNSINRETLFIPTMVSGTIKGSYSMW
jgi:hypothetical protein